MSAVASRAAGARVEGVDVSAFTIPTEAPESDGTLEWDSTTIVIVEVEGGGERGLGYTYGDPAVRTLIESKLAPEVQGADALSPAAAWSAMQRSIRNAGQQGVGAMAVSAVDVALWGLKACLPGVGLADGLPRFHEAVPIYGSGGFTSYSDHRLRDQLVGWAREGIPRVKIKVGRDPGRDMERLRAARDAIGADTELF